MRIFHGAAIIWEKQRFLKTYHCERLWFNELQGKKI